MATGDPAGRAVRAARRDHLSRRRVRRRGDTRLPPRLEWLARHPRASLPRSLLASVLGARRAKRVFAEVPRATADRRVVGHRVDYFQDWLVHEQDEEYWKRLDLRRNAAACPSSFTWRPAGPTCASPPCWPTTAHCATPANGYGSLSDPSTTVAGPSRHWPSPKANRHRTPIDDRSGDPDLVTAKDRGPR